MIPSTLRDKLVKLLGPKGVLVTDQDLSLYEYDGGVDKARPESWCFREMRTMCRRS